MSSGTLSLTLVPEPEERAEALPPSPSALAGVAGVGGPPGSGSCFFLRAGMAESAGQPYVKRQSQKGRGLGVR
jgi:hypothetical protein